MNQFTAKPVHGGDLISASDKYGIALSDWLDLSTGINPDGYTVTSIPAEYYRQLPSQGDLQLLQAAKRYYECGYVVPAAGSQQIIQLLPRLRPTCRVAIPDVGYQEHAYHWQNHGHSIVHYRAWSPQQISELIEAGKADCVVLINPSNPTAVTVDIDLLTRWQKILAKQGGWLIIDEAFADVVPGVSFARLSHLPGVIVLRSLGKFFGLAGVRVGFALCEQSLSQQLSNALGPWCVAGPSQYIATKALQDSLWQSRARDNLHLNSQWMLGVLREVFPVSIRVAATGLFVHARLDASLAYKVYNALAKSGILVRYWKLPSDYHDEALLRFGLISMADTHSRRRFQSALLDAVSSLHAFSIT
jgi:cobalamin biosynthesis protein CobC